MRALLIRTAAVLAIVIGVGVFVITIAIGDCAAFGGACPSSGLNDDVLGGAGVAGAMIGAGGAFAWRSTWRTWRVALIAAVVVGALLAAVAYSSTSS